MAKSTKKQPEIKLPPVHDWRTTDIDEINKRRQRAREESFVIRNLAPAHPVFSNFQVKSGKSGLTYSVEIREVSNRQFACDCVDFRINNLGTCKHVESVLLHLESRYRRLLKAAAEAGSTRVDVVVDPVADTLKLNNGHVSLPRQLTKWFGENHRLVSDWTDNTIQVLREFGKTHFPQLRVSQEVEPWL